MSKFGIGGLSCTLPDHWLTSRLFFHRKSGLKFAIAADGTSEWVRPEDVERFKTEGAELLGKRARKTALSQFQPVSQRQEQVPNMKDEDELSSQPEEAEAYDNKGAAKGLNDNAHGIDRFGYRVR